MAVVAKQIACSELIVLDDDWDDERDCFEPEVCSYCDGDGGDKWNDYCTECPMCLGEGVRY